MKPDQKKPTQVDVARLAGVSTATVSRVVNSNGAVNAAASERVLEAIDHLHYIPHAGARALATQRSRTLGIIVPSLGNACFTQSITGFERIAQVKDYNVIMAVSYGCENQQHSLINNMIERGVDGLLFVGTKVQQAVHERLAKAGVQTVQAWSKDRQHSADGFAINHAKAMADVVDHLVSLGHQRIGLLDADDQGKSLSTDRTGTVGDNVNVHGLELMPTQCFTVSDTVQAGREGFWKVIDQDVSAIICTSDTIAIGAILEAQKSGLNIPKDLSITGFGDIDVIDGIIPALTTVRVGAGIAGAKAARRLIDAIEGKARVDMGPLESRLIVRQSSGKYR